jgi:hypothetical protein
MGSGLLAGAVLLFLDILAIFEVVTSHRTPTKKILWTVFILIAPFLGMLAYFFLGRDHHRDFTGP